MSQQPSQRVSLVQRLTRNLGIRGKIILPYLLLSFAIAILGVYLVTVLVTDSIEERFNNQLADAGVAAGDSFRRLENDHLSLWRILAATEGLPEAVGESNPSQTQSLIEGPLASTAIDSVLVVNTDYALVNGLDRTTVGTFEEVHVVAIPSWDPLERVLDGRGNTGDRTTAILIREGTPFVYTVAGLNDLDGTFVGALLVGTRLDNMLRSIREEIFAEISVYNFNGELLGSTLPPSEFNETRNVLTPQHVDDIIRRGRPLEPEEVPESFLSRLQRGTSAFRLIYGPWQIRDNIVAVYSVALESNFVVSRSATSRITFAIVFSSMMVVVLIIGILLSRRLITPILRLVRASQAVAEGDLTQRSGVNTSDEIGTLAAAFDNMTINLEEQRHDLQELLQAHKEEATKTNAIVSSIADGVLVIDPQGQIIMMNDAAEHILGDMAHNFSAGTLKEMSESATEDVDPGILMPFNSNERRQFVIDNRTISAHDAPVVTNDGQMLGTVVVLRDVTNEVEVDRLKDAFIEQVSHELRTPLTPIKGFLDLMLQTSTENIPEKHIEFLKIINRHVDALTDMITELLDVSQLNAGSLSLRMDRVALNELVSAITDEFRAKLDEKEIALEVSLDPESTEIIGDSRRLGWAITQLIDNAYHYTSSGGSISVSVACSKSQAVIAVTDTGIGITEEDKKHLFTRFFRSTSRIHSNERGVGLGLFIVRSVVEAHRGEVDVKSEPDKGSTFYIRLPVGEAEGEPPLAPMRPNDL